MYKDRRKEAEKQEKSRELEKQLVKLLWPVLVELKQKLDRRLVSTFLELVMAIIMHQHRNHGLLLSECGCTPSGPSPGLPPAANANRYFFNSLLSFATHSDLREDECRR